MNYSIQTSLPLFESSVIVERVFQNGNSVAITGREISNDLLNLSDITKEWSAKGNFGFVTSDVYELETLDKLLELTKVVRFARQANEPVEFLFLVYKSMLSVYWRNKAPAF